MLSAKELKKAGKVEEAIPKYKGAKDILKDLDATSDEYGRILRQMGTIYF